VKVRLSPQAQRQARSAAAWWKKNRDKNPTLFRHELARAKKLLAKNPYLGARYDDIDGQKIYRLNLSGTQRHLYYRVDEEKKIVRIIAVWGAAQEDPPDVELDDTDSTS
jgi:plasmid stabilization system protein ParE